MNKEQVIDFLTKCGMWVKDGSIKKEDVSKAVTLISEEKSKIPVVANTEEIVE